MFDLNFIIKSHELKQQIARGDYSVSLACDLERRFEELLNDQPYVFNLETTNACNMKCKMCPRTTLMTRKVGHFSKEFYPAVLDQVQVHASAELQKLFQYIDAKYGIREKPFSENVFYYYVSSRFLTLHGYGEPILDPNIVDVVKQCSQRSIPTYFSTVPANILVDKVRAVMEAGLGVLKFSLDSLDDEHAKIIRGTKNNFSEAMQKIDEVLALKNADPTLKTQIVVTMISLQDADEQRARERHFMEMWEGKNVHCYVKSQDNQWYGGENPSPVDVCTKEYCEYPWTSMTIMADGSVVPCTQDYNAEMVMGNVRESSLRDIWMGEKYREFRRMHINGRFPAGCKCVGRCDQLLVVDRLRGVPRKQRII